MGEMIAWMAAEAEDAGSEGFGKIGRRRRSDSEETVSELRSHSFPRTDGRQHAEELATEGTEGHRGKPSVDEADTAGPEFSPELYSQISWEEERARRIYRARTVTMLRRYMRYSIETGRLPSLLGREFFRTQVTSYTVVTFEDRVIFVHDMERCINKLDEFSRQIIARHILQEHDQAATGRLLQCTERTVRTYVPIALDLMSEILLDVGLLERLVPIREKSCQGGKSEQICVSSSEESKNKV